MNVRRASGGGFNSKPRRWRPDDGGLSAGRAVTAKRSRDEEKLPTFSAQRMSFERTDGQRRMTIRYDEKDARQRARTQRLTRVITLSALWNGTKRQAGQRCSSSRSRIVVVVVVVVVVEIVVTWQVHRIADGQSNLRKDRITAIISYHIMSHSICYGASQPELSSASHN